MITGIITRSNLKIFKTLFCSDCIRYYSDIFFRKNDKDFQQAVSQE
jgi:hypothetical protein